MLEDCMQQYREKIAREKEKEGEKIGRLVRENRHSIIGIRIEGEEPGQSSNHGLQYKTRELGGKTGRANCIERKNIYKQKSNQEEVREEREKMDRDRVVVQLDIGPIYKQTLENCTQQHIKKIAREEDREKMERVVRESRLSEIGIRVEGEELVQSRGYRLQYKIREEGKRTERGTCIEQKKHSRNQEEGKEVRKEEEGDRVEAQSDISSIDLIDKQMLEDCMRQHREKIAREREEDGEEMRRVVWKNRQISDRNSKVNGCVEGEKLVFSSSQDLEYRIRKVGDTTEGKNYMERRNNYKDRENQEEGKEGREEEQMDRVEIQLEKNPIDPIGRQRLDKFKEGSGRLVRESSHKDRRVSSSVEGKEPGELEYKISRVRDTVEWGNLTQQKNNYEYRNRQEEDKKGREEERRDGVEVQSDSSSIDLIDKQMLDKCMKLSKAREKGDEGETEEERGRIARESIISSYANNKVSSSVSQAHISSQGVEGKTNRSSNKDLHGEIGRKQQEDIRGEQLGSNTNESKSTTSTIAALFRDERLEREGKKIGRKSITRRKVWERWKGVIRGEIRREIKRKRKQAKLDKGEEDRKLVFDYTTKGLSVDEVKLLGRGEAFCIVDYKIDEDRSKVDIYQYQRRLRLHEIFRDPGTREEEDREEIRTPVGREGDRTTQRNRERGSNIGRETREIVLNTQARVGRESRMSIRGRGGSYRTSRNIQSRVVRGSRAQREEEATTTVRRRTESRVLTTQGCESRDIGIKMRSRGSTIVEVVNTLNRRGSITNREEEGSRQSRGGRGSIVSRREGVTNIDSERGRERRSVVQRREGGDSSVRTGGRGEDTQNRRGSIINREEVVQRREGGDSSVRTGGRGEDTQNRRGSIINREEVEIGEKEGRRLPSMYDPDSQNRNLHRYNTCIQEEIMLALEDKKVKFRDNVLKEERKAVKALKQRIENKEIIITRADKGSGLVAVDYDKYIHKGTRYIEEEAGAYSKAQETEQEIIGRLTKERNKIAEQLKEKGVIELQTATYVKKQLEEKITGIKFYYKIHKDRQIDSMPLRPLQSCIKAPMQHLSIVLTDILQPLLIDSNIPSFIFDSNQLLYRLSKLGKIPNNCTLISSDVSALYPSIPHEEGFRAMKRFLQICTTYNTQQIGSILRALELVITENYMMWNNQIYKQTSGVAMGTPVAVAYANIFMDWVDGEVRDRAPYIYEHIRYIDDNLFIVPGDKVEELMEIANNILPPHIRFTYEKLDMSSGKGLPFLDTQLFIGADNSIESRLYTKTTDRHAYLLPSSYHPSHVTRNIPLAVFGRLRKICSREEWFVEDAEKAVGWLENRGYKKKDIQKAVAKTRLKDRWDMIEKIESNRKKDTQRKEEIDIDIPLIMTYNQHVGKIKQILKDRQPLLDSAFKRTKVRPRLSFRRKRNLSDIIVQKGLRGPIGSNREESNIFSKYGESPGYRSRCPCRGKHSQNVCRCCSHSKGEIEGIKLKLYKPVSCNSRNIVYVIGCNQCKKRYVGETQQRLKDRLAQYMYNVDKLKQPLYLHFRYMHKLESMYIGIVETVRGVEPFMRKVREVWWINHLKTLEPSGFNVKLECNQIYEERG